MLCELARGGMGVVAVGRLQGVHGVRRLVALKIIHPHLTRDEQYSRMFLREAEIASLLHHGNVVPVIELGQEGEQYYLVMEYFPSLSLLQMMRASARRRVPMPYAFSAAVIADACAGLQAAHELRDARGELLGVVHRDATPSNLLLGEDGAVKVTDFGVARAASAVFEQLTGDSGIAKGKLAYLSPEQVRGEATDRRSDVFTLGVVLYELLGRTSLFRADNELALARAIIDAPIPDVRTADAHVPDALASVVARALQRDRARRFQTAAEMQDALLDALHALPVVSRGAFVRELLGDDFAARREEIATAEAVLGFARPATASSAPSGRVSLSAVRDNAAERGANGDAPTAPEIPAARAASVAPPEASPAPHPAPAVTDRAPSAARSRWTAPLIVAALIGAAATALLWSRHEAPRARPRVSAVSAAGERGPSGVNAAARVAPTASPERPVAENVGEASGSTATPAREVAQGPRENPRASSRTVRAASDASARASHGDRGATDVRSPNARPSPPNAPPSTASEAHPAAPAAGETSPTASPAVRPRLEM